MCWIFFCVFSKGEGHWDVWTVLLWTSEAVQSDQAFASFKILLPPFCKKWHGCKVGAVRELDDFLVYVTVCVILCVHLCAHMCLSLSPSYVFSLQRFQWGGGPVHLMQRAIATLPTRAGEGRGDLALSQVAEALELSEGRWHLLHFGDGGGRLGMSFIILNFLVCLFCVSCFSSLGEVPAAFLRALFDFTSPSVSMK